MFSSMATSRRCSSCRSLSSFASGGQGVETSICCGVATFTGVALITWLRSPSPSEASPSLASAAAGVVGEAPGSFAFIVRRKDRRFAEAAAKRSSNSSHAALNPARCVSYLPPDLRWPATAKNNDSTGCPAVSMGATPTAASPLQRASSERASHKPGSGKPSALASSFLEFMRLQVLPTSRGKSWPTVACSSRRAHGSVRAGTIFFISALASASSRPFFVGVF
mmetsp:Transcript_115941/g.322864  ORF Transcript_115941/g.322864 Transcript_115941/m.322864 type:complete len:223 (+) Transcript_115941:793-1461(+)